MVNSVSPFGNGHLLPRWARRDGAACGGRGGSKPCKLCKACGRTAGCGRGGCSLGAACCWQRAEGSPSELAAVYDGLDCAGRGTRLPPRLGCGSVSVVSLLCLNSGENLAIALLWDEPSVPGASLCCMRVRPAAAARCGSCPSRRCGGPTRWYCTTLTCWVRHSAAQHGTARARHLAASHCGSGAAPAGATYLCHSGWRGPGKGPSGGVLDACTPPHCVLAAVECWELAGRHCWQPLHPLQAVLACRPYPRRDPFSRVAPPCSPGAAGRSAAADDVGGAAAHHLLPDADVACGAALPHTCNHQSG